MNGFVRDQLGIIKRSRNGLFTLLTYFTLFCTPRTSLSGMEPSGYPMTVSSRSVAARLSSETISSRRGSETSQQSVAGSVSRNVVTHVDDGGSNPLSSLSIGDIPLSHLPHATSG